MKPELECSYKVIGTWDVNLQNDERSKPASGRRTGVHIRFTHVNCAKEVYYVAMRPA